MERHSQFPVFPVGVMAVGMVLILWAAQMLSIGGQAQVEAAGGPQKGKVVAPASTPCPIQFTDVPPGSGLYDYVRCLACRGIVSGFSDGTFRPNNAVTRGQLSKFVSNAAGFSDPVVGQIFEDVPPLSNYYDYIGRLVSRSIVSGYPCGGAGEPCGLNALPYFRPGNHVTRGQGSKIIAKARVLPAPPPGQQTFEDVHTNSTYWQWIEELAATGAINGFACGGANEPCVAPGNRRYFRPSNNITRGQGAKIVAKTFFPGCQTPMDENSPRH